MAGTGRRRRCPLEVADVDLTITGAAAHLDRSFDMRIRNDDGVPEHLAMVATPDGGRGDLVGGKSAEGGGPPSTAEVLLLSGTTVAFRSSDPSVLLHHVHGVTVRHTLPPASSSGWRAWSTSRRVSPRPDRPPGPTCAPRAAAHHHDPAGPDAAVVPGKAASRTWARSTWRVIRVIRPPLT